MMMITRWLVGRRGQICWSGFHNDNDDDGDDDDYVDNDDDCVANADEDLQHLSNVAQQPHHVAQQVGFLGKPLFALKKKLVQELCGTSAKYMDRFTHTGWTG